MFPWHSFLTQQVASSGTHPVCPLIQSGHLLTSTYEERIKAKIITLSHIIKQNILRLIDQELLTRELLSLI